MSRRTIDFNLDWVFQKPGEEPYDVTLPHTWNAEDGQDGGNDYWRGTAEYRKTFFKPEIAPGEKVFLSVDGAAMTADVVLNGKALKHHEGGYSTFRVDLTDALQEENELKISVDNSVNDHVYPQKADFTFYGGIYRDVSLIITSAEHFELERDGSNGIHVIPQVQLPSKDVQLIIRTWETGGEKVLLEIPTANGKEVLTADVSGGFTSNIITLKNARLWDGVKDPYLYTVTATLFDKNGQAVDAVSTRFGCRSFSMDPEKGFFLNGRPYLLRGVSRHQDRKGKGNALSYEDHAEDMAVIREIGANTVRLAHYQHAQEFYDLCDENGLIVWAEIPYISEHMPNGRENTLTQMRELVTQCANHPSIVCWGLSNEITAAGEVSEDLYENHRLLNELCHDMDPTRPTVMAHAFMLEKESPLIPMADLASYNLYFGWYLGELQQNEAFFDEYHAMFPDRVIGFSEYGADANVKFHTSAPEKGDYSEEYQCVYHEHLLKMIEARPYLWATHVWNLFDFAADGRDEGGKKGENQKGLVEFDHKTKKDAFYLYKAAWSNEPFVHLCGKRYVDRAEDETEIKVYSNQPSVMLCKDGEVIGTQEGSRVFVFRVPIEKEHVITAISGVLKDEMTIVRAAEENPDYYIRKKTVVNWFDREDYDPTCFSIKDTMGALSQNPQTAAILGRMMERMTASRGDVAKSANNNPNLKKMMAGLSLESLIKQAGDSVPAEMIKSLNNALQKIKK
ncbi:MAG: glycoside hydrolase family 2 protein [Lachnospiraceae bacterium]|nr:glycoside hydrolase family 2 protein [Lachnospiraceae bacterium]